MNWDEEESKEPKTTPDTENSTRINSSEGELSEHDKAFNIAGRGKWERLSNLNTGAGTSLGNRDETTVRRQERGSAFDVIADQLHLPDYIHREGRNLMMDDVDLSGTNQSASIHLFAFCLAAVLVNDYHDERDYHPERTPESNDEHFSRTATEFDFSSDVINRYMQRVKVHV